MPIVFSFWMLITKRLQGPEVRVVIEESIMTPLLTKKEVCELLRVSSRTLDRYRSVWRSRGIDTGEVKLGKLARFKREAIERIVNTPKCWM
jgi:hypothetical protein